MRAVYEGLLDKIERRGFDVINEPVKLGKMEKMRLALRAGRSRKRAPARPPAPKKVVGARRRLRRPGLRRRAGPARPRGDAARVACAARRPGAQLHRSQDRPRARQRPAHPHGLLPRDARAAARSSAWATGCRRRRACTCPMQRAGPQRAHGDRAGAAAPRLRAAPFRRALVGDKWAAIEARAAPAPRTEIPARTRRSAQWLARWKQTPNIIRALWEPLCLAALNEPVASGSAALFATVIRRSFLGGPEDSTIYLSRVGLSELFAPEDRGTARDVRRCGVRLAGTRCKALRFDGARAGGRSSSPTAPRCGPRRRERAALACAARPASGRKASWPPPAARWATRPSSASICGSTGRSCASRSSASSTRRCTGFSAAIRFRAAPQQPGHVCHRRDQRRARRARPVARRSLRN